MIEDDDVCSEEGMTTYLHIKVTKTDGSTYFDDDVLCSIVDGYQIRFVDKPVYFHSRQTVTIGPPCWTEQTNITEKSPAPRESLNIPGVFELSTNTDLCSRLVITATGIDYKAACMS